MTFSIIIELIHKATCEAIDASLHIQPVLAQKLILESGLVVRTHTIGKTYYGTFANQLSPTDDPSLNSKFADSLEQQCPSSVPNSTLVEMDGLTPTSFDNAYHQNVDNGKGLFSSEAQLYANSTDLKLHETICYQQWPILQRLWQRVYQNGENWHEDRQQYTSIPEGLAEPYLECSNFGNIREVE